MRNGRRRVKIDKEVKVMATRGANTFWTLLYVVLAIFIIFSIIALFGVFSTATATFFYTVTVILLIAAIVHWVGLI